MIVSGSAGGPLTGATTTIGAATGDAITVTVPTASAWLIEACAVGRDEASGDVVGFTRQQMVRRGNGAPVLVGSLGSLLSNLDLSLTGANLTFVVSSTDVIARVTGVFGRTIDWTVSFFAKAQAS